jgi:hypothetical protein
MELCRLPEKEYYVIKSHMASIVKRRKLLVTVKKICPSHFYFIKFF